MTLGISRQFFTSQSCLINVWTTSSMDLVWSTFGLDENSFQMNKRWELCLLGICVAQSPEISSFSSCQHRFGWRECSSCHWKLELEDCSFSTTGRTKNVNSRRSAAFWRGSIASFCGYIGDEKNIRVYGGWNPTGRLCGNYVYTSWTMNYKDPVIFHKQYFNGWFPGDLSVSLADWPALDARRKAGWWPRGRFGGGCFKKAKGAGGCQIWQTFQKSTCKKRKDGKVLGKNLILFWVRGTTMQSNLELW